MQEGLIMEKKREEYIRRVIFQEDVRRSISSRAVLRDRIPEAFCFGVGTSVTLLSLRGFYSAFFLKCSDHSKKEAEVKQKLREEQTYKYTYIIILAINFSSV